MFTRVNVNIGGIMRFSNGEPRASVLKLLYTRAHASRNMLKHLIMFDTYLFYLYSYSLYFVFYGGVDGG